MKQFRCGLTTVGLFLCATPAFAQQPQRGSQPQASRPQQQATQPLQCDTAATATTVRRNQVLGPRDSTGFPRQRVMTRRVRMADGSVRVRKYVTKSGVPVTKSRPACPVVATKTPGNSVGDVVPPPTTTPPPPEAAPGEVVPPTVPLIGRAFPFPLIGGLLLGGTAIAVGSHRPTNPAATGDTTTTTPPPPPPVDTTKTNPPPPPPVDTTKTTPPPPPPTTPVPEPASVLLVGGGVLLAAGVMRRRR